MPSMILILITAALNFLSQACNAREMCNITGSPCFYNSESCCSAWTKADWQKKKHIYGYIKMTRTFDRFSFSVSLYLFLSLSLSLSVQHCLSRSFSFCSYINPPTLPPTALITTSTKYSAENTTSLIQDCSILSVQRHYFSFFFQETWLPNKREREITGCFIDSLTWLSQFNLGFVWTWRWCITREDAEWKDVTCC